MASTQGMLMPRMAHRFRILFKSNDVELDKLITQQVVQCVCDTDWKETKLMIEFRVPESVKYQDMMDELASVDRLKIDFLEKNTANPYDEIILNASLQRIVGELTYTTSDPFLVKTYWIGSR